jgi:hypothetical protein
VDLDHVTHVKSKGRDEEQACARSHFGH